MNQHTKPMSAAPAIEEDAREKSWFYKTTDGLRLFVYEYIPRNAGKASVFIIPGITGINHHAEENIITLLSNAQNRVVVLHPRGTGFSEGVRGDIDSISRFIQDYAGFISTDKDYIKINHPVFLFGHSMSCAVVLAVAEKLENIAGTIIINPPLIAKQEKGMSPSWWQYIKYGLYFLFARHKPVVNMSGDPSLIKDESDREESEQRQRDPLLVKYFSMHYMNEVRKIIKAMPDHAARARCPLLLIYGLKDSIVDKKGCDQLFRIWQHTDKTYLIVPEGRHGKSSVKLAIGSIRKWMARLSGPVVG